MPAITEALVKNIKLPTGKAELFVRDTRLPGFALRVRPKADGSLSKLFLAIWEEAPDAEGKRKRRKASIGEWGTFSADEARAEATTMLQAAKKGDNPAKARKAKKAAPRWPDLVKAFEAHIGQKKAQTQKAYRGVIRRRLQPFFGEYKISDIDGDTVRNFMAANADHPVDANRALATLSIMLGIAMERGWTDRNPVTGVKRNTETAREAWLDERDLPKFVEALGKVEGPHADAIRFAAITGWRITEVRTLTHEMVSIARAVAELPDTKNGRSIRGLSSDAITIIQKQAGLTGYVFRGRGGAPVDYRRCLDLLKEVCASAKIPAITLHSLRHTAATWAAINGASSHELMAALGWRSVQMAARYVSRSEALSKAGAERAAQAMNILGPKLKTPE